jgi:hypothetical protein
LTTSCRAASRFLVIRPTAHARAMLLSAELDAAQLGL